MDKLRVDESFINEVNTMLEGWTYVHGEDTLHNVYESFNKESNKNYSFNEFLRYLCFEGLMNELATAKKGGSL